MVEHGFVRHENETGERRLRDQHPVERIAMWTGKAAGRLSVQHSDRQLDETLTCERAGDVQSKGRGLG